MPTRYKPKTDHEPLDYRDGLNRIDAFCDDLRPGLQELFADRCKIELEFDDYAPLINQLKAKLTRFALDCNALPLRTPRQLMTTVTHIARQPEEFLKNVHCYDPEVVALVGDASAQQSAEDGKLLKLFERGIGVGPAPEAIATAARLVLQRLQSAADERQAGGRTVLQLRRHLAADLAGILIRFGGKVARVTHDGESGMFHSFLEMVLPAVSAHARSAGFALSVRGMVVEAMADQRAKEARAGG